MAQTIHLVFKTHLDIGFTDHAAKVRAQYHERFIPQALDTAEHFFAEDPNQPKFIWTTGAWLIWDHLETQGPERRARLERAIGRGLIRWHALPFTTHSELMSPDLFRAGLSYSQELDQRFGVTTRAAKMTDVPGHTRGIVPLLAEASVRFLHLGVNTASPVPDVPDVFRWQGPDGSEVVVMYQDSYGGTHFPRGFSDGISFAHTSDNIGPQSVPQVADVYRAMAHRYPDADVRAATLEDYGALLWERRDEFPALDIEIGDSWIYGAATDPHKMKRFLALRRLYDSFAEEALTPAQRAFGRRLTLVPEHTWGVDIKSYLRDETAWDRAEFDAARKHDHRFAFTAASWAEQRGYLDDAMSALERKDRALAQAALQSIETVPAPAIPGKGSGALDLGGWHLDYDPQTGDVGAITAPDGTRIAGIGGTLLGVRHESYGAADVQRHMDTYLTHREEWALLDHGKPGLENARTARSAVFAPRLVGVSPDALVLEFPAEARELLGAPASAELRFEALREGLQVSAILRGKPANRMPEAGFLLLTPAGVSGWDYCKMGLWQPGNRVARRGGGQLQAVEAVRGGGLEVIPLDTPLVAPAGKPFMGFDPEPPDLSQGLRFNLYNNKWGTNFPMWWEGDSCARFKLRVV